MSPAYAGRNTKMNKYTEIIKAGIIAFAILMVGWRLIGLGKTYVRNQAIDGCAMQSVYEASFDENGRRITVSEPQKHLYDKCLLDKGIILNSSE